MADIITQLANKSNDFAELINVITSKSDKSESAKNSDFSNFLNNLNSKAKNVQSNYKETTANNVVKSNTSSINKKALENTNKGAVKSNEKTTKETIKNTKDSKKAEDLAKDTNKSPKKAIKSIKAENASQKEVEKVSQNTSDNSVQNTNEAEKEAVNETNFSDKKAAEKQDKGSISKKESSSLNIETNSNNNSPVEPSPVIFLEENNTTIKAQDDDSTISIATVLNTATTAQKDDEPLEETEVQDTLEDTTKITQAIEDFLKEDNSLEDNKKEEILKTLQELLSKKENSKEVSDTSFSIKDEDNETVLKTFETELKPAETENKSALDKTPKSTENDTEENNIAEIKQEFDSLTQDINTLDEIANISPNKTQISNFIAHADSLIEKIKSNPLFPENKVDGLDKIQNVLKSITSDKIETTLNEIRASFEDCLTTLKETFEDVFKNSDTNLDTNLANQKEVTVSTVSDNELETINSNDFKVQDSKDSETLNDILKILNDNKVELDETQKEELKAQIKTALDNLDNSTGKSFEKKADLAANSDNKEQVKAEVKQVTECNFKDNLNNENNENSLEDLTNKTDKASLDNENFKPEDVLAAVLDDNSDNDLDISLENNTKKAVKNETVKTENKVESKTEVKSENKTETTKENKNNLKETITKIADSLVEEITEEINLDFDLADLALNEDSALSVADEVTKLALNENSSIDANTRGSVIYDSIGTNKVIKAIDFSSFKPDKITQELDNTDFLSKISTKIENLAQNQGQTQSQKLTLVLRPHDLGRLSIEMVKTNEGLSANILAQNDSVRNYIEKHIQGLKDQLAQSGVNVNNIQIKTAGSNNTSNYQNSENSKDNLAQNNEQNKNNNQEQHNENHNKKEAKEILDKITNLDFKFERNFSAVLNKAVNYGS